MPLDGANRHSFALITAMLKSSLQNPVPTLPVWCAAHQLRFVALAPPGSKPLVPEPALYPAPHPLWCPDTPPMRLASSLSLGMKNPAKKIMFFKQTIKRMQFVLKFIVHHGMGLTWFVVI